MSNKNQDKNEREEKGEKIPLDEKLKEELETIEMEDPIDRIQYAVAR